MTLNLLLFLSNLNLKSIVQVVILLVSVFLQLIVLLWNKAQCVMPTCTFFFQSKWVCMCEWQPGISLLSATYVSVNRPAELQRGVKFCPIPDLWPRGAFFLTERNLIFPLHLWYIHLPRPARCPTKSGPCMSSSTCTDLHLCTRARKAFLTFLRHRTLEKFSRPSRLD